MTAPALTVRDLATHFFTSAGVVKAVDGVSFSIAAGEVVGLVGESGSGKSVTGFSLIGLVDPPGQVVAGSVMLAGEALTGKTRHEMRAIRGKRLAMVFQDPMMTLNPVLTVGQQMRMALTAHQRIGRKAADARAVDALTRVGIPEPRARLKAYPHELSGGMRQRVVIAIALLHGAEVIVADEPTTALDVSIQAQILAEMRALVEGSGTSLLWISHDLATVSVIASRVLVMYAGRIVEEGPVGEVLSAPAHPYTAGLLGSLPAMAEPGQPLPQIPGTVGSPLHRPAGCAFRPRCARATATCLAEPPRFDLGSRAHRCFHPLDVRQAA